MPQQSFFHKKLRFFFKNFFEVIPVVFKKVIDKGIPSAMGS